MNLSYALAVLRAAGLLMLPVATPLALPHSATSVDRLHPVPKANCGPQDRTETVQGQITLAERFSSEPQKAYNCNLELVGTFEGEGAGADVEVYSNCAYYSTAENPRMQHPGVAVLDTSNSRIPKAVSYLNSAAMLSAHESLEVSQTRGLLLASSAPSTLDVYDISDCLRPRLLSSVNLPAGLISHAGQFTEDGLTFYGARFDPDEGLIFALDMSAPSNPRTIAMWSPPLGKHDWITHSAIVNRSGTRVYISMKRMTDDWTTSGVPNGLAIFDIGAIQAREAKAEFRLISTYFWEDTHGAEGIATVAINKKPYLIFSDNLGTLGFERPVPSSACKSGRPGHGFARIIDIGDEKHPRTVSRLMLEVSEPNNCSRSMQDPTLYGAYGSFACSVDNADEGKLAACGSFEAGLRVFDIRDPANPREIAYYKPPARRTESRPGSLFRSESGAIQDNTADSVIVAPKFRKSGEEIWFTSVDNGFQVVRFSDRFIRSNQDLFRH
jgi:hypothetical protein